MLTSFLQLYQDLGCKVCRVKDTLTCCHILVRSETSTGMAAMKLATPTLNKICSEQCTRPHASVWDLNSLYAHLSSVTLLIHPEIQPRDNFLFPRIPPFPRKVCAHSGDLGVFIPACLNIYFSAQGEAEKKNVSAGFNLWRI